MGCEKVFCGYRLDGTEWWIEVKELPLQYINGKLEVVPHDDYN